MRLVIPVKRLGAIVNGLGACSARTGVSYAQPVALVVWRRVSVESRETAEVIYTSQDPSS